VRLCNLTLPEKPIDVIASDRFSEKNKPNYERTKLPNGLTALSSGRLRDLDIASDAAGGIVEIRSAPLRSIRFQQRAQAPKIVK
jgi:hypothetical protein